MPRQRTTGLRDQRLRTKRDERNCGTTRYWARKLQGDWNHGDLQFYFETACVNLKNTICQVAFFVRRRASRLLSDN